MTFLEPKEHTDDIHCLLLHRSFRVCGTTDGTSWAIRNSISSLGTVLSLVPQVLQLIIREDRRDRNYNSIP